MIPGLAIAMRVLAVLWFALAIQWETVESHLHALATAALGIACFAYGEWLDHRDQDASASPHDNARPGR